MLFTISVALAGIAAAMPAAIEKRGGGGTCSGGPWAADSIVIPSASPHGTAWCETGWGGTFTPISTVTAWTSDYYCTGVQFTYADGTVSQVYGQKSTEYAPRVITVNYALGDLFDSAIMYGPPTNGVLQHLYLHSTNGDKLNCGAALDGTQAKHVQDVAAGVLLGAQGNQAANVDSIGFLFLRSKVAQIDVTNLNFPNGPTGSQGINPQDLATGHFYNNQDTGNTTWMFQDSKALTTTQTFTQASTTTFGMTSTVSLSVMIPLIGSFGGSEAFMWSYAQMDSDATTNTETTTVTWSQGGSLAPHTGVNAAAVVGTGAGTYPYTSDVTLQLADGSSVEFSEAGSLKFNAVSSAIVEVSEANSP